MAGSPILTRIDQWLAEGLIDQETAERLRAAEAGGAHGAGTPSSLSGPSDWLRFSAVEFFAYIGIGFVVAAYYWAVTQQTSEELALGIAIALASAVFLIAGWVTRGRVGAIGRAASPALLVGGLQVPFATFLMLEPAELVEVLRLALAAFVWLVVALAATWRLRSLPTQIGWLSAAVAFAWFTAAYLGEVLFGSSEGFEPDAQDTMRYLLLAISMVVVAMFAALVGEREARDAAGDPGARRRAALTRFWAGMTAVVGLSVTLLVPASADLATVEPIVCQAIVLLAALVLVAVSARTSALSYLLPGGLGVVLALTAFNAEYISDEIGTAGALLVEGLVLLGAGVGVQVARSRLLMRRTAAGSHAAG